MNLKKYIVSPENPEGVYEDFTPDEIKKVEEKAIRIEQEKLAKEQAEQAKANAKASALAKLSALGLTEEEVKAIL